MVNVNKLAVLIVAGIAWWCGATSLAAGQCRIVNGVQVCGPAAGLGWRLRGPAVYRPPAAAWVQVPAAGQSQPLPVVRESTVYRVHARPSFSTGGPRPFLRLWHR